MNVLMLSIDVRTRLSSFSTTATKMKKIIPQKPLQSSVLTAIRETHTHIKKRKD